MASKEADNETHKRETPKPSRPLPKLDTSLLYSTRIVGQLPRKEYTHTIAKTPTVERDSRANKLPT